MKNTWQCILTKICVSHFPQKHIKKKINHIFRFCFLTHTFFPFFYSFLGRVSGFNMLGLMEDKDHVASQRNSIYLIPTQIHTKKIIPFFFLSLSLLFQGRDEDYVTVYLNKILYLSFSHKYILKIIHFFLFLRSQSCVWFILKNQLIYKFLRLCQKFKPKFFFPTTQENTVHKNHNTKI